MTRLTKDQKDFLKLYGIDFSSVFDATGLGTSEWKAEMRESGALVAVGVTRCAKQGHSMRTRAGHCVMCRPSNLSFQFRWRASGEVYIAYSRSTRLVKIGVATSSRGAEGRVLTLKKQRYAEVYDWELWHIETVIDAGRVENAVHQCLAKYRKSRTFLRGGKTELAQEVFSCTPAAAKRAITRAILTM
jgi:hypothetical protein